MEIHVFKTNLINDVHIRNVGPVLNQHPLIKEWNVDLHDCDKVLRVIAENVSASEIETIVSSAGYLCQELT